MEADIDLHGFPEDLQGLWLDGDGEGLLPPPRPPPPPDRIPPADPGSDMRTLTWSILASLAGLSLLKVALFAVGGALAAVALGAVFVATHGLLIAGGGTWFWKERYR